MDTVNLAVFTLEIRLSTVWKIFVAPWSDYNIPTGLAPCVSRATGGAWQYQKEPSALSPQFSCKVYKRAAFDVSHSWMAQFSSIQYPYVDMHRVFNLNPDQTCRTHEHCSKSSIHITPDIAKPG